MIEENWLIFSTYLKKKNLTSLDLWLILGSGP